jgi:hypothetical protein
MLELRTPFVCDLSFGIYFCVVNTRSCRYEPAPDKPTRCLVAVENTNI